MSIGGVHEGNSILFRRSLIGRLAFIGQNSERGLFVPLAALLQRFNGAAQRCKDPGQPQVAKLPNSRPQKAFLPSVESRCTKGDGPGRWGWGSGTRPGM